MNHTPPPPPPKKASSTRTTSTTNLTIDDDNESNDNLIVPITNDELVEVITTTLPIHHEDDEEEHQPISSTLRITTTIEPPISQMEHYRDMILRILDLPIFQYIGLLVLFGVIITILITISILFEAVRFFKIVGFFDFILGTSWNPQIAIREGQATGDSSFGMIPIFLGTLLITFIAMIFAAPLGLFGAIYLSQYAKSRVRDVLKPILEILAGIPTVVYGYFAAVVVAPFLKTFFAGFGVEIASESALGAGFVMGIMIIPFILSLSEDAISAVPLALKDGALAMGSTKSEMIKKVVLVSAFPNIISAVLLAISRAIGETMIVVMSAGLVATMTINPLNSVTTATVQIVTLLTGDQESDSPKTLAAFALGLVLFVMTLIFNIIALISSLINFRYRSLNGSGSTKFCLIVMYS